MSVYQLYDGEILNDCELYWEFIKIMQQTKEFELWKQGVEIIRKDEHRTIKGILEIAKIRDKIGRKHKLKNYRDYNWFKEYLDKNYKDYKPAYYNGEN